MNRQETKNRTATENTKRRTDSRRDHDREWSGLNLLHRDQPFPSLTMLSVGCSCRRRRVMAHLVNGFLRQEKGWDQHVSLWARWHERPEGVQDFLQVVHAPTSKHEHTRKAFRVGHWGEYTVIPNCWGRSAWRGGKGCPRRLLTHRPWWASLTSHFVGLVADPFHTKREACAHRVEALLDAGLLIRRPYLDLGDEHPGVVPHIGLLFFTEVETAVDGIECEQTWAPVFILVQALLIHNKLLHGGDYVRASTFTYVCVYVFIEEMNTRVVHTSLSKKKKTRFDTN